MLENSLTTSGKKIIVSHEIILCDGRHGKESEKMIVPHPAVYLYIEPKKGTICPYCGNHFFYETTSPIETTNSIERK